MKIPRARSTSIYVKMGGYDNLVRVLDGICSRMMKHPELSMYFKGHSLTSKRRMTQNFLTFVCEKAGGPGIYGGSNLKVAHEGLGITHREWDVFLDIVREAAKKNRLDRDQTDQLLGLFGGSREDVVERKD